MVPTVKFASAWQMQVCANSSKRKFCVFTSMVLSSGRLKFGDVDCCDFIMFLFDIVRSLEVAW